MSNGNDHAYPVATVDGYTQCGLTKRELFAAMAMKGLLSNSENGSDDAHIIARWSVEQADALLAELERSA